VTGAPLGTGLGDGVGEGSGVGLSDADGLGEPVPDELAPEFGEVVPVAAVLAPAEPLAVGR
jgi:hypothetical protein